MEARTGPLTPPGSLPDVTRPIDFLAGFCTPRRERAADQPAPIEADFPMESACAFQLRTSSWHLASFAPCRSQD